MGILYVAFMTAATSGIGERRDAIGLRSAARTFGRERNQGRTENEGTKRPRINAGDFSIGALLISLLGAVILLAIVNFFRRGRAR